MQPPIPWSSIVSVFVIERMAVIHSLECTVPFSFVVPLLSLAVTHCHLLSLVFSCEYCKASKNSFFHETPLVAVCELKSNISSVKLQSLYLLFFIKFLFFTKWRPFKNYEKSFFYFIEKALFVIKIFKFFYFQLPLFFSLSDVASKIDPR